MSSYGTPMSQWGWNSPQAKWAKEQARIQAMSKTPSMDDKKTPSPPTRTNEQYEADKERGVQPVGQPKDKKD